LRLPIKEILPEAWRIRKLKAAIPRGNRVFVGALPKLPKILGNGRVLLSDSSQSGEKTAVCPGGRHLQNARAANCVICEAAISFDSIKHLAVPVFQVGVLCAVLPQNQRGSTVSQL